MRGGYQIIDFQKIALSDSNTKVDGVYQAIQDNPLKVLQLNNINLGGTLKDDVFTTATKGTNKYTFDVYDGILTVTSADNVRWVSHDTIQTVISDIDDLQSDVSDLQTEASDIKDMISDAYNAETAYTAGQYCIYNDTLYKCILDTTAGTLPTDTDHFSEVTVADEISALYSDLEPETITCGNAKLEVYGNLCILQMSDVEMPASQANFIPLGYRPTIQVWGAVSRASNAASLASEARVSIDSSGTIITQVDGVNSTAEIRGQVSWTRQ